MDYEDHYQRYIESFNQIKEEQQDPDMAMNISRRFFIAIVNHILKREISDSEKLTQIKAMNDAFSTSITA
ncbi:hypothetical protein MHH52_21955 [Paenibacillus sp. FSL K6-0276]|uniref:hypothetical protein n=1 Tax=Paenibacillus sp. FSL K6-0276 TaxID=2921450 RepID=UPI0030EEC85E